MQDQLKFYGVEDQSQFEYEETEVFMMNGAQK